MASLGGPGALYPPATSKPDEIRDHASITIKSLVHNFETLAMLFCSTPGHGESRILIDNIKDALVTSYASYLPKVNGTCQTPTELVHVTMRVLDLFRQLAAVPQKRRPAPHLCPEEAMTEKSHNPSHHPSESRSTGDKMAISAELYYSLISQHLKLLRDFGPTSTRTKAADKSALIDQICQFISRADPSGVLEMMVKQILFSAGTEDGQKEEKAQYRHIPSSSHAYPSKGKGPIYHDPLMETEPRGLRASRVKPGKHFSQPSPEKLRDMPRQKVNEGRVPLAPLGLPCPGVSGILFPRDFEGAKHGGLRASSGGYSTVAVAGSSDETELNTRGVVLEHLGRLRSNGKPQLNSDLRSWGTSILNSAADLYKPVLLDYLSFRQLPKEDSPTLIIDSAARPFTFSSFWRNLNLTEAGEVWQWTQAYQDTVLETVYGLTDILVSHDEAGEVSDGTWLTLRYPKVEFIQMFQKSFQRKFGEPSWTGVDIGSFLNTCGTCRSMTAESYLKPAPVLDSGGRPLLHFSIRPSEEGVIFRDFLRQISVPASQTYTSLGQTMIITPSLYDPHQTPSALTENTTFELDPKFNWLKWDLVVRGFVGKVPESVLKGERTKVSRAHNLYTLEIPIIARTIASFPKGVQFETRVRAHIRIRICDYLGGQTQGASPGKEVLDMPLLKLHYPSPPSGAAGSAKPCPASEDYRRPQPEVEHGWCTECADFYDVPGTRPKTPDKAPTEDVAMPVEADISIFLWGQGFREWLNIVFLADSGTRKVKHHRISRLELNSVEADQYGQYRYPLMDTMGNTDLRIGVELEILSTSGNHVLLHREICKRLEKCTNAKGLFCKTDINFMPSFTALGPVDGVDKGVPGGSEHTDPNGAIPARSTIRWTKVVLQKVLGQFEGLRYEFSDTIKVHLHIGVEGNQGYDLKSIKSIAKTIILFGGLLNGVGMRSKTDDHECCQDSAVRARSNTYHVQAIEKASSLAGVIQIMTSLESSGYTHHREGIPENQRYDFALLASQDVVIWTQVFLRLNRKEVIDWISMILFINKTAVKTDSLEFMEFAKIPITPAIFDRFVTNKTM